MKKSFSLLLAVCVIFLFSTQNLKAQDEGVYLFLNAGLITDDSFKFSPFIWQAGLNLDFHLNEFIMISPECYLVVEKFEFDPLVLAPGVLLNVKFESFFAGAGVSKWFVITGDDPLSSDWLLKLNAGFKGEYIKLTVWSATPFNNLFKKYYTIFGFTVGFGF